MGKGMSTVLPFMTQNPLGIRRCRHCFGSLSRSPNTGNTRPRRVEITLAEQDTTL